MPLAESLRALEDRLNDLLSSLESDAPAAEAHDSSWERVLGVFAEVRAVMQTNGTNKEEHRAAIERCLRLYAVGAGMLARRREELATERSACVDAQVRLRRTRADAPSGASCDMQA